VRYVRCNSIATKVQEPEEVPVLLNPLCNSNVSRYDPRNYRSSEVLWYEIYISRTASVVSALTGDSGRRV
jgi:hypothetical protein